MEPSAAIIVVSNVDGKKYKMVLRGDMSLLTIGKVKRYLHTATGIDPSMQMLRFNNQAVTDGMTGSDLGLYDGAVMFLDVLMPAPAQPMLPLAVYPPPTPASYQGGTPYRYGATNGSFAAPAHAASPVVDIERIRAEERQRIETELRLKELHEQELLRAAERVRSQERERMMREQEEQQRAREQEQQRAREQERLLQREAQLQQDRRELEAQQRAIEDAKQRDIEDLRRQQHQLSVERQRLQVERSAPSPQDDIIRQQQQEIERLRAVSQRRSPEDTVQASLAALSRELQIPPLQLDINQTCAVTLDDGKFNVLLTYDPATQRLFMYATILNSLPADPTLRLQLYELLLEGALLGRDMCGGGVGVSTKNNVVLMSASLDMQYSDAEALGSMARPFLEGLRKWNGAIETLLTGDNPHHRRVPTMQAAPQGGYGANAPPQLTAHSAPMSAPFARNGSPGNYSAQQGASPPPFDGAASSYAARHAATQQYYQQGSRF